MTERFTNAAIITESAAAIDGLTALIDEAVRCCDDRQALALDDVLQKVERVIELASLR